MLPLGGAGLVIGNFLTWSGQGAKAMARAKRAASRAYDRRIKPRIDKWLGIARQDMKITRASGESFKLILDDVSIFDPLTLESFNLEEDNREAINDLDRRLGVEGENSVLSAEGAEVSELPVSDPVNIQYYRVELVLKDQNRQSELKLGEIDFGNWEDLFEIKVFDKQNDSLVAPTVQVKVLETLKCYAKVTTSRGLPNELADNKLVAKSNVPLLGHVVNWWRELRGAIVQENVELEGDRDGNQHLSKELYLESLAAMLKDTKEDPQLVLSNYYATVERDLENRKRMVQTLKDHLTEEIKLREIERNQAKKRLWLILGIISGISVLAIAAVVATAIFAPVSFLGLAILTNVIKPIKTFFSLPFSAMKKIAFSWFSKSWLGTLLGVAGISMVAGAIIKGIPDYKKAQLALAKQDLVTAEEELKDIKESLNELGMEKTATLQMDADLREHKTSITISEAVRVDLIWPILQVDLSKITYLNIEGKLDPSESNSWKTVNQILSALPIQAELKDLVLGCSFGDISKENQEKLRNFAGNHWSFQLRIENLNDQKLEQILITNRYLAGQLDLSNQHWPLASFKNSGELLEKVRIRLEENYSWPSSIPANLRAELGEELLTQLEQRNYVLANLGEIDEGIESFINYSSNTEDLLNYLNQHPGSREVLGRWLPKIPNTGKGINFIQRVFGFSEPITFYIFALRDFAALHPETLTFDWEKIGRASADKPEDFLRKIQSEGSLKVISRENLNLEQQELLERLLTGIDDDGTDDKVWQAHLTERMSNFLADTAVPEIKRLDFVLRNWEEIKALNQDQFMRLLDSFLKNRRIEANERLNFLIKYWMKLKDSTLDNTTLVELTKEVLYHDKAYHSLKEPLVNLGTGVDTFLAKIGIPEEARSLFIGLSNLAVSDKTKQNLGQYLANFFEWKSYVLRTGTKHSTNEILAIINQDLVKGIFSSPDLEQIDRYIRQYPTNSKNKAWLETRLAIAGQLQLSQSKDKELVYPLMSVLKESVVFDYSTELCIRYLFQILPINELKLVFSECLKENESGLLLDKEIFHSSFRKNWVRQLQQVKDFGVIISEVKRFQEKEMLDKEDDINYLLEQLNAKNQIQASSNLLEGFLTLMEDMNNISVKNEQWALSLFQEDFKRIPWGRQIRACLQNSELAPRMQVLLQKFFVDQPGDKGGLIYSIIKDPDKFDYFTQNSVAGDILKRAFAQRLLLAKSASYEDTIKSLLELANHSKDLVLLKLIQEEQARIAGGAPIVKDATQCFNETWGDTKINEDLAFKSIGQQEWLNLEVDQVSKVSRDRFVSYLKKEAIKLHQQLVDGGSFNLGVYKKITELCLIEDPTISVNLDDYIELLSPLWEREDEGFGLLKELLLGRKKGETILGAINKITLTPVQKTALKRIILAEVKALKENILDYRNYVRKNFDLINRELTSGEKREIVTNCLKDQEGEQYAILVESWWGGTAEEKILLQELLQGTENLEKVANIPESFVKNNQQKQALKILLVKKNEEILTNSISLELKYGKIVQLTEKFKKFGIDVNKPVGKVNFKEPVISWLRLHDEENKVAENFEDLNRIFAGINIKKCPFHKELQTRLVKLLKKEFTSSSHSNINLKKFLTNMKNNGWIDFLLKERTTDDLSVIKTFVGEWVKYVDKISSKLNNELREIFQKGICWKKNLQLSSKPEYGNSEILIELQRLQEQSGLKGTEVNFLRELVKDLVKIQAGQNSRIKLAP